MKSISVLLKPVSGACNLSCDYCFFKDEEKHRTPNASTMSQDTLESIIEKIVDAATEKAYFCFQGGEPLLAGIDFFHKVIELQKKINQGRINIINSIQTNGTLINKEWCDFFKDNNILVGISLDGVEATHNRHRRFEDGTETYQVIMNNIALLRRAQVDFNILTVVNKDTADNIDTIYESYREENYGFQQYIACRDPLFEQRGIRDFSLKPHEYGEFLVKLFDMWKQDLARGRAPSIRQFENYINIILGGGVENCEQCGNCSVTYAIDANGDVFPCDFYMLDEYKLGNINHDDISSIDKRRIEIDFVKKSTRFSDRCRHCQFLGICRNGCQRNRVTDDEGQYINYYCEGYRYFFEHRIEDLVEIARGLKNNGR